MIEHIVQEVFSKIAHRQLVKERVSNGNKKLDRLVVVAIFLGIGLFLASLYYLEKTIIDFTSVAIILLIPGLFLTSSLYDKLNDIDGMKAHWIVHYFLHSLTSGAVLVFLLVTSNYYFSSQSIEDKQVKIIEASSSIGPKGNENQRVPFVIFKFNGIEKRIDFKHQEMGKVMKAKTVKLKLRKGFLGYYLIDKYEI